MADVDDFFGIVIDCICLLCTPVGISITCTLPAEIRSRFLEFMHSFCTGLVIRSGIWFVNMFVGSGVGSGVGSAQKERTFLCSDHCNPHHVI